jgi:DNA-binding CsgD family transcriptional regulator
VFVPDYGPVLTTLELDVLNCAAYGLSASETGQVLSYSTDHIKGLHKQINRKLEARNKTHAVAIAWRAGLLS